MNGTGTHDPIDDPASLQHDGDAQLDPQQGMVPLVNAEPQPNKVRITTPYLTKYERARVLGTRALQIR